MYLNNKKFPRGIRNHNPGNIVKSPAAWRGKVPESLDPVFEQFFEMRDGVRALAQLLHTYYFQRNLTTIEKIINRWAPPHENDTQAYIDYVKKALAGQSIVSKKGFEALVWAIIEKESGKAAARKYIPNSVVIEGINASAWAPVLQDFN